MKTLMLWQEEALYEFGAPPKFVELNGDYRHLNGVYLNAVAETDEEIRLQDELSDIMYIREPNEDGGKTFKDNKQTYLSKPTKDWDFFIHCGFIP